MPVNKQKITKELCWKNDLIFFPKTQEECTEIQRRLIDMGYGISLQDKTVGKQPISYEPYLQRGLVLTKGLVYGLGDTDNTDYLVCTPSQFDHADAPDLTPQEQQTLLTAFNKLSARVARMAVQIDAIEEALQPQKIEKPVRSPSPDGGR